MSRWPNRFTIYDCRLPSSPCHLVTLSPCHLVTLSPCHRIRGSPMIDPNVKKGEFEGAAPQEKALPHVHSSVCGVAAWATDVMMAVALARLLRDGENVFHGVAS